MTSKANFVVVSNRLPVDRSTDDEGNPTWALSPGGLVTALGPVMNAKGGAWLGWAGQADEVVEPFRYESYDVVPLVLTKEDIELYYEGMSNGTIWPLYHDVIVNPGYHREWWDQYVSVNQKFADATAELAEQGATVWVQDYQLQLVPQMLREKRPDLRIGFFLHIPFPPDELFMQLPWRRQLIEGLLGADTVGFQTASGAVNFAELAERLTGASVDADKLTLANGRVITARDYPISIDSKAIAESSQSEAVTAEAEQMLEELGHPKRIFLGVDRLDYTKGLRHRVKAFSELFLEGSLDPATDVFIQLATPSRERVEDYRLLHDQIDLMVSRLNSQVGGLGRPAIQYLYTSVGKEKLNAFYRIADVCVVTPLRDGMNLVAKEYLAAHGNDDGALVLSEFAGAAHELDGAYMVNPYDMNGMKAEILKAANDDPAERARRMHELREQVMTHDIDLWADTFLSDLEPRG